jgi:hypothetical protein
MKRTNRKKARRSSAAKPNLPESSGSRAGIIKYIGDIDNIVVHVTRRSKIDLRPAIEYNSAAFAVRLI